MCMVAPTRVKSSGRCVWGMYEQGRHMGIGRQLLLEGDDHSVVGLQLHRGGEEGSLEVFAFRSLGVHLGA
jgi:hypothetical protein